MFEDGGTSKARNIHPSAMALALAPEHVAVAITGASLGLAIVAIVWYVFRREG